MALAKTFDWRMRLLGSDEASPTFQKVTKNINRQNAAINKATRSFQRFGRGTLKALNAVRRSVFSLKGALIGLGAGLVLKSFIDIATQFENFRVQLKAVEDGMGDVADRSLAFIKEFAAATPFTIAQVVGAFVQLRAVGISVTEDLIRTVGDVAFVFNRNMEDVASSIISLEVETLRRLGVELDRTGAKAILVSGTMRIETDKTSAAIREGLIKIWAKRFPNAMKEAENTFTGSMALLKSEWEIFRLDVTGSGVFDFIKDGLKAISAQIRAMRESGRLKEIAQSFSDIAMVSIPIAIRGGAKFASVMRSIAIFTVNAQNAWAKLSFSISTSKVAEISRGMTSIFAGSSVELEKAAAKRQVALGRLVRDEELTSRTLQALVLTGDPSEGVNKFLDETIARIKELQALSRSGESIIPGLGNAGDLDKQLKGLSKGAKQEALGLKIRDEAQKKYRAEQLQLEQAVREKRIGLIRTGMELENATVQEQLGVRIAQFAQTTNDEIAITQFSLNERTRLEEQFAKEQKTRDERAANQAIRVAIFKQAALSSTLSFISASALRENKVMFEFTKAADTAIAIMSTYKAANVALASAPPPFNYALAAAVVVAGLANVAKIQSTTFGSTSVSGGAGGGGLAFRGSQAATTPITSTENQGPQTIVNIEIIAGAVDDKTLDLLQDQLIDSLGRVLEDRQGRAGNITIQTERV